MDMSVFALLKDFLKKHKHFFFLPLFSKMWFQNLLDVFFFVFFVRYSNIYLVRTHQGDIFSFSSYTNFYRMLQLLLEPRSRLQKILFSVNVEIPMLWLFYCFFRFTSPVFNVYLTFSLKIKYSSKCLNIIYVLFRVNNFPLFFVYPLNLTKQINMPITVKFSFCASPPS